MMNMPSWLDARECGASGSHFETTGTSIAGSSRIEVTDVGDFQPGQGVLITRSHIHYANGHIYAPQYPWRPEYQTPMRDELELRGFDGSRTAWQVFVLHIENTNPCTFSWLVADPALQPNHRRWTWQGRNLPVAGDWQPLMDGVEIRFRKTEWEPGQVIAFHARDRMVSRIKSIEGCALILEAAPNRSVSSVAVCHLDQAALQAAVNQAAAEARVLYIPNGHYRLLFGLMLQDISLRIEGASRDETLLDISDGNGAVFTMRGGREITVRNLSMVGHTGFNELPWNYFRMHGGYPFWPTASQQMEVKGCAAAHIVATERVLFEDIGVRRMASEAFYSQGPDRLSASPEEDRPVVSPLYTKSITYSRCVVADCASNAFNNNDYAENTSILNCHIERVLSAWEGPNRFTRFIGNFVKNAHAGSFGNVGRMRRSLLRLGAAQAVITHNVFEGGEFGHGLAIRRGATQVIVANNLFVNFSNQKAITISDHNFPASYPPRSVTVTGNIIDLTHVEGQINRERVGIAICAGNVIVSDNQIYVRGAAPGDVIGIQIAEWAVNVQIHDNLIENCGFGIRTGAPFTNYAVATGAYEGERYIARLESVVQSVLSATAFEDHALPGQWDFVGPYAGWNLHWLSGGNAGSVVKVAGMDPHTRILNLCAPLAIQAGDRFAVYPSCANWQIHHNTITGCRAPVVLDGYGSASSRFTENIIAQGSVASVSRAISVKGCFAVDSNHVIGYDVPGISDRETGVEK